MRQESRLSVEPSSTLYTVVSPQVGKIFRGFGILELGQMPGGSQIGLDLVDISARRSVGRPTVYSIPNTNLVLRLVFVNVLLLPNTPILTNLMIVESVDAKSILCGNVDLQEQNFSGVCF